LIFALEMAGKSN